MKSGFELEMNVAWARDRLLAEAAAERMAALTRRPGRAKERLAARLYALADWLSAETAPRLKTAKDGMRTA